MQFYATGQTCPTDHGDDCIVVASAKQIALLGKAMKKRCELNMKVPWDRMLDKLKKFEFSMEPSVGQEQDWSTSGRSATRTEDHSRVEVGNAQLSVHTSRAGKRVRNKSDHD